jgi:hypothetical protein
VTDPAPSTSPSVAPGGTISRQELDALLAALEAKIKVGFETEIQSLKSQMEKLALDLRDARQQLVEALRLLANQQDINADLKKECERLLKINEALSQGVAASRSQVSSTAITSYLLSHFLDCL